jgi:hypothetical protein
MAGLDGAILDGIRRCARSAPCWPGRKGNPS